MDIISIFKEYRNLHDFKHISKQMEDKFKNFWKDAHLFFVASIVLDHMAKLFKVKKLLEVIHVIFC